MENEAGGLLCESACKRPVHVRSDPITDNYAVEARPFARGKFASVRRCRHLVSGAEYAAKYMRKRRRAQDVRHEIMHEAHVLQLSSPHPHIVRMHEVYETPSEIVLVLELVPGGELQRVLDDEEVVPEREAARLLRQILDGVGFLHQHKIAHLDLKPQNLLLTKPFPEGEVKLCDFGISRLITKGIEIREIVGTPDYVAPEVLHYEPISLPTDMWSLGVLTYVLLSGHSPFGGDTKQETFCNITRGALDFPGDLFAGVTEDAKDFIRRLLIRNPRERMTAEECLSHTWLTCGGTPTPGIRLTLTPESASEPDSPAHSPFSARRRSLHNSERKDNVLSESPSSKTTRKDDNTLGEKDKRLSCKGASDNAEVNSENVHHNSPLLQCIGTSDYNSTNGTSDYNGTSDNNGTSDFNNPSDYNSTSDCKARAFYKIPSLNGSVDRITHNVFRQSPPFQCSNNTKDSLCGKSSSPKLNGEGSPLLQRPNDMKVTSFSKSSSPKLNDVVDQGSQNIDSGILRKGSLPQRNSAIEQKETTKSRSVDMVVAQFEGMSKRIVFSEEIIVDERVGMVY